jgi:ABC-type multidrug transport system fused ATPase/permease subunit
MPAPLEQDPKNLIAEEAKDLGITDFISVDTFVGDGEYSKSLPGAENEEWMDGLSGGQYQTVALARAFIGKHCSTVFVLDEPSSNLDPQKEHDLFERLRREKDGRITIFISHNLQTCRASDCILVMDEGCLVEWGSHADLVKKENGLYAKLYNLQNQTWYEET